MLEIVEVASVPNWDLCMDQSVSLEGPLGCADFSWAQHFHVIGLAGESCPC